MSTEPKNNPSDYAPAAIPGTEDEVFQEPLNEATDEQFTGFVKDLDKLRKQRKQREEQAPSQDEE